jgi:thioredoxin reductase (NADPH)
MNQEDKTQIHDVIILGAGPAGLAAALYAARADLNPLVLTGTQIGGQAALTHQIENYPGFPSGVGGVELSDLFQKNAERFGAVLEFENATSVDLSKRPFTVETYGKTYKAKSLIITTGASPNELGIPGEQEFRGRGVSYCGTCDGWFFKEKKVVVVGGGDSALEEGIFLTRYATSVTIIHRRDELRGGAILKERAFANPKISFIWDTVVKEIKGNEGVEKVITENVKTGEKSEIATDGFFVFIGHTPNSAMFKGQLEMDDAGYLIVDKRMHTSVEGVYAGGEIADPHFRQVITSAGMGAAAAIEATHFLENNE